MARSSITNWRGGTGGFFDISAAHSGDGTITSCGAQDNMIICDFTALGSGETVTIDTPFAFEIIDVWLVVGNGENVTSKTLTVNNTSTAVSSALSMATDKGVASTATLDEDQAKFAVGDDDLVLTSSAHADGGATVYIVFR
jgi:hypothetical protein